MWHFLLYKIGEGLVSILPLAASYWIADRCGDVKRLVSRTERTVLTHNLSFIFPEKTPRQRAVIVKNTFRNFARYLVDFFRASAYTDASIDQIAVFKGEHHLDAAAHGEVGAILLSGHIGNWEMGAVAFRRQPYPLSVVALSHKARAVNDFFLKKRCRHGVDVIPVGNAFRKCVKALKENRFLAILGDRDFNANTIPAKFFGHMTKIPRGPLVLAVKTKAPVLPAFMIKTGVNAFTFFIEEPLRYDPACDDETNIVAMMSQWLDVFARYIRRYPDQLFIFEKMW